MVFSVPAVSEEMINGLSLHRILAAVFSRYLSISVGSTPHESLIFTKGNFISKYFFQKNDSNKI
jgi:hypothetical protein